MEVECLGIAELGAMLRARSIDPVDLAWHFIARAKEDREGVFIAVTADRALDEARRSQARFARGEPLGPLDGIPVAWKDLFDLANTRTTAGSRTRRDASVATRDAVVVERLSRAGMVSFAKSNLSELAFSGLGINPHFGTPRNPNAVGPARVPGGSSSGAAVAVALGMAPCGIGTDTSGSVRIPAAFNGLVGFKPSAGRYPMDGVFPLAPTLDVVGPIARSVGDVLLLDEALCGGAGADRGTKGWKRTLVVPEGILLDTLDEGVRNAFEAAIDVFELAGWTIQRRQIASIEEACRVQARLGPLVGAEAAEVHAELLRSNRAVEVHWPTLRRLVVGSTVTPQARRRLRAARRRLAAALADELGGEAMLAMPTVAILPPEIEPLLDDADRFASANMRVLRNTMTGSFLDMPGISLPIGCGASGTTCIGLLLSMISGRDESLLGSALEAERVLREAC